MNYLFTSESVSEGHPDKVADQISDAILDEFLRQDPESKVACETFCTAGLVVVGGEVRSDHAYVDIPAVARRVIGRIGYNKAEYGFDASSCGVISTIHEQSADINRGVVRSLPEEQGAGDQGMMFGYAVIDTDEYMPLALSVSHKLLQVLADIRHNEPALMPYLRPDAKAQVTVEFSRKHCPVRIHTIVVSTQHDEFDTDEAMHGRIENDIRTIVIPRLISSLPSRTAALFDDRFILHVNPTGKFVIGGPAGDTGLTGRKIIVDTYGGRGAHGGGAFSGKDPSKVDRSAAYAARHIAKNLVAAGVRSRIRGTAGRRVYRLQDREAVRHASGCDNRTLRPQESHLRALCLLRPHGPRALCQGRDAVLRLGEARCRGTHQGEVPPVRENRYL